MSSDAKLDFKGSGGLFFRNVLLYVLIAAPVFSLCLMGMQWFPVVTSMVVLSLPFVLIVALLVARFDGFSFDDEQQQVAGSFDRRVPYQSITRIDINETGRLVQVSVKQGLFRKSALLYALDRNDKPRLMDELRNRFPQSSIRERRFVDWKSIGMVLGLVILMTAGFHLYLFQTNTEVRVMPRQVSWTSEKQSPKKFQQQQYMVGNFSIAVPNRFRITGKEEGIIQFEDSATGAEIMYTAPDGSRMDFSDSKGTFVRYVTGIYDYYSVLDIAYSARFGIIPLVIKDLALKGLTDVNIIDIRLDPPLLQSAPKKGRKDNGAPPLIPALKGFLLQGKKKEKEVMSVLLMDRTGKSELHIFASGRERMDEKAVKKIAAGVHMLPGR